MGVGEQIVTPRLTGMADRHLMAPISKQDSSPVFKYRKAREAAEHETPTSGQIWREISPPGPLRRIGLASPDRLTTDRPETRSLTTYGRPRGRRSLASRAAAQSSNLLIVNVAVYVVDAGDGAVRRIAKAGIIFFWSVSVPMFSRW